ncbi:hypothetical protein BDA96_10G306700 [Sorghum bicolor]|uniref:Uncharacterized protein n=1 Tax=Sorghum bicolor TaxID=4558 RepID=A0A921U2Q0_SORBI|nr:hypothetical protein BDA96_10G306700 [Sorghum bicolor]
MTSVGNIWRDSTAAKPEPLHTLDLRQRVGDDVELYNAAGEGVSASGNGTSSSPRETTRAPSPGIIGVFFCEIDVVETGSLISLEKVEGNNVLTHVSRCERTQIGG